MNTTIILGRRTLFIALALLFLNCSSKPGPPQGAVLRQEPGRYLKIIERGGPDQEIDVTDWKPGEDFVLIGNGFYYPWSGEALMDCYYDGVFLYVEGKLVGVDLVKISLRGSNKYDNGQKVIPYIFDRIKLTIANLRLVDEQRIVTVCVGARDIEKLKRYPNLIAVSVSDIPNDTDLVFLGELTGLKALSIHFGNTLTDTSWNLEPIEELTDLRFLSLGSYWITDDDISHFSKCNKIRDLNLGATNVTGKGLEFLKDCPDLRKLDLWRAAVSDSDIEYIGRLTSLRELDICGTRVTDSGVEKLKGLKNLRILRLPYDISDSTVEKLQKWLPSCYSIN